MYLVVSIFLLNEIQERLNEIKSLPAPLVLCFASGGRSGQAAQFLAQNGITTSNGGSWLDVS